MSDPVTSLHYTSNGNFVNGQYAPGADGFNLADVTSASELSELPSGVKALVWLGMTDGVTAAFMSAVESFAGSSQVYGFYLADEPAPSATTAANFKAESDWIHAKFPGAKTFIIEQDSSSELTPSFYYTPANTDIDLFGLDPYPVNSGLPGGFDLGIIPLAVQAAEAAGIPRQDLAPVYQAFGGGGYSQWAVPTPAQEQQILSTWGSVLPNPVFDYAYSWGAQVGDTALSNDPGLQQVFAAHNAPPAAGSTTSPPAAPTIPYGVVNSNDSVTLTGTAPAGSMVRVWDGGANPLGTATANSAFVWSFTTADLSPGAYAFTATDTTSAGTSAKSSALNVTVPTAAASTTSSSAGSTTSLPAAPTIPYGVVNTNHSVTLTGTAPAGATVTVWDGGANPLGTATANSAFVWSFTTADLSAGSYAFTATDTTSAGTSGQATAMDVTVPASPPAAPTIPYGVVNSNDSVTLTGTAPAGSTVTVWDGGANPLGTATASSSFVWSFTTADLSAGSYAFTATDTTAAGTSVKSSALAVTVPLSAAPAIAAGAASAAAQQPAAAVGGGEVVTAGSGPETFAYTSVSQSTGPSYDIIADANWSLDKFHLSGSPVALLDPHVYSGSLSTASFDSDLTGAIGASHLSADAAILFTPSAGTLAGNTFLIVDENGAPGYQAGKDFVFNITGAKGTLTTANFI
jgi:Bacterial Ig-like domain